MSKSFSGIIFEKIIGFLLFIIILLIANLLLNYVQNNYFIMFLSFFNSAVFFLFIILVFDIVSGIFWNTKFPIVLLAPLASAVLGMLILSFILSLILFLFENIGIFIQFPFEIIYFLVFVIIIVIGYVNILSSLEKKSKKGSKKKTSEEDFTPWEEIEEDFKKAFSDLGSAFNKLFHHKKRKTNK